MSADELARFHATVEGQVQGVGFRYFVQEAAVQLGLTGWVRNRVDGSVEVLVEGARPALNKLAAALYRGPRGAIVTGLDPEWSEATGEFSRFTIRQTG
jgi:acylphosphatase